MQTPDFDNLTSEAVIPSFWMTARKTAFVGSVIGLVVSGTILVVLWNFGVSTRLRLALWPSSIMLTVDWCCTVSGILGTISAVAINCLMYVAIFFLLRAGSSMGWTASA